MSELNRGIILRFMREALREFPASSRDGNFRYSALMNATLARLSTATLIPKIMGGRHPEFDRLDRHDHLVILLTEGYQQLLALGYIIPQPEPPRAPNPDWFVVTDIGRQWASGSDPFPEDQQGYLAALGALVPNLDPVIRQYVQEALLSYERRALFASAVMIGAASEKAVYLLMESLHTAVSDPTKKKRIQKVIEGRQLPTMFKQLLDSILQAKTSGAMPYSVHEGADLHLLSLQEAIRVQRNDAVHPQVGRVELETVRLALASFPAACRKVDNLMNWFSNNQL